MNLSLDLDVMSIVIQLISTLILFGMAKIFLAKPMKRFLEKRREFLNEEFAKAELANSEATEARAQADLELKKIQDETGQMMQEASAKAQVKYDNILATAKSNADAEIDKARERIKRERDEMYYDAKKEIAQIANDATAKLIKKEIDQAVHDDLFDEFVNLLGGADDE